MSLKLRTATAADVPAIVSIHQESVAGLAKIAPEGFGSSLKTPVATAELEEMFLDCLKDDAYLLIVAEVDNQIVAFLSAMVEEYGDDLMNAPFLTIEFVETTVAAQGQGAATELMTFAEDFARQQGITNIDLIVWETNTAARRLYDRLGYQCLETRMAKLL